MICSLLYVPADWISSNCVLNISRNFSAAIVLADFIAVVEIHALDNGRRLGQTITKQKP